MALTLRWRSSTSLPVDGSPLKPETFRERTSADAARVSLRVGNATAEVGELFEIEGDAADGSLVVEGDLTHVYRLGRGMATGSLKICLLRGLPRTTGQTASARTPGSRHVVAAAAWCVRALRGPGGSPR